MNEKVNDTDTASPASSSAGGLPQVGEGWVVKALEWVKHPNGLLWRADTIIGRYQVYAVVRPVQWAFDAWDGVAKEVGVVNGDENDAKLAAQADFDQRIRSAIVSTLPQPNPVQAVTDAPALERQGGEVVAGWKLVPIEPTPAMLGAAWAEIRKSKAALGIARLGPGPAASEWWAAMLAAAPATSSHARTAVVSDEAVEAEMRMPPEPLLFPNAEWCDEYAKWHRGFIRRKLKREHEAALKQQPAEGER